jgi:hypothetical protein
MTNTTATTYNKPYRRNPNSKPTGTAPRRPRTPSLDEAIKMARKLNGRDGLYGMLSTNERGDVTEVGFYNYHTKKYALYRSDLVDAETLVEFKTILGR